MTETYWAVLDHRDPDREQGRFSSLEEARDFACKHCRGEAEINEYRLHLRSSVRKRSRKNNSPTS